jgi:hypothetical protein
MDPREADERKILKRERDELLQRIGNMANGYSVEQQRDLNRLLEQLTGPRRRPARPSALRRRHARDFGRDSV